MISGDWMRRLPPLPGELLTSCLARNAYAHGTSPYRFLALFWPGDPVWNRDFDRHPRALGRAGKPGADWVADIAARLRVPLGAVEAATLQDVSEVLAGGRAGRRGDTPLLLSAGVHHRTRRRHGLQFCPDCLAEGVAHYRRNWRLGFVVACDVHGRSLRDGCPHCDAPVVPHRSLALRMTGCHACGRSLTVRGAGAGKQTPHQEISLALQRALLAGLSGEANARVGPWVDRTMFDGVRALAAVSAPERVHEALRASLELPPAPRPATGRLRFEQARAGARGPWLETVAAWLADWPRSFRMGAHAARLTRRSFARQRMPEALAAEVARLPDGIRRDRTWVPVLHEPVLRRLRRRDPVAYRALRARRILVALDRQ